MASAMALHVSASDFIVNGISYNVVRNSDATNYGGQGCEVAPSSDGYTGDITIPSIIMYGGTRYYTVGIGEGAFKDCAGLTSVNIACSYFFTGFGAESFSGCTSLKSVTLNGGYHNITVGRRAFSGSGIIEARWLPLAGSIGEEAFLNCTSLTEAAVNSKVPASAFSGCTRLESIAFYGQCDSIMQHAFSGCTNLQTRKCLRSTPPYLAAEAFDTYGTISVISNCHDAYYTAEGWSNFTMHSNLPLAKDKESATDGHSEYLVMRVGESMTLPYCNAAERYELCYLTGSNPYYISDSEIESSWHDDVVSIDPVTGVITANYPTQHERNRISCIGESTTYAPDVNYIWVVPADERIRPTAFNSSYLSSTSCTIANFNTAKLYWDKVDGAAGYEVKWTRYSDVAAGGAEVWDAEEKSGQLLGKITVDNADSTSLDIPGLYFSTSYSFAIRTLSPKGEGYHSEWYGYNSMADSFGYLNLQTWERYFTPSVISVTNITHTGMRVKLNCSITDYTADELQEISEHFNYADDTKTTLRLDYITVKNESTGETTRYDVSAADIANGYMDITGLEEGVLYTIDGWDSTIPTELDACYNTVSRRTKKDAGEPILISHVPTTYSDGTNISEYDSMDITSLLSSYMDDATGENQVFWLEGGKSYHLSDNVSIYKGMTLMTYPDDAAQGKQATLCMGGLSTNSMAVKTYQFMLGRQPWTGEDATTCNLAIDSIRFINLHIDVPMYGNYGTAQEGSYNYTGNYFMNMYANGLPVDLGLLEWQNCTITHITRGFFRIQGQGANIHNIKVLGNSFYNCGYYDKNGSGYGYFYIKPSNAEANALENFEFAENVVYESPNAHLISNGNSSYVWPETVRYNIDIHNNTFVNWNTQGASSQPIVVTRYVPGGSVFGFHDNVIIVTAKDGDGRYMKQGGWDIRSIKGGDGSGTCTFNIGNNWTTAEGLQWNVSYAIDSGKYSPGAATFTATCQYPYGTSELTFHTSTLKATELMVDPNPPYIMDTARSKSTDHMTFGIDGLYYKQTATVQESDICKAEAGCQRLRDGNIVLTPVVDEGSDVGRYNH